MHAVFCGGVHTPVVKLASRWLAAVVVLAVALEFCGLRHARAGEPADELSLGPAKTARGGSVGFPWHGHLVGGVRLTESEVIRHVPEYEHHDYYYGTWQLVQLLVRSAHFVEQRFPGSRMALGELSAVRGGRVYGHQSHRSGRDVDIGFYLLDDAGAPAFARAFVPMRRGGVGRFAGMAYHFDDARNWALLSRLLSDDDAHVQFVFLSSTLQRRLLREAKRQGASEEIVARAKTVLFEPRTGNKHTSHFHVRIYCPAADSGYCRDRPPYYPWYPGTPPGGVYAEGPGGIALLGTQG